VVSKNVWRQFSDRTLREHEYTHLVFDAMDAVGLDYHVNSIGPAGVHEQVPEKDPDVVHTRRQLKGMSTPRSLARDAVNDDGRSTEIKKKREGKKAGFDL